MIQCKDGHFYDPAKHSACPWCTQPFDVGGEGKTTPVRPNFDDQAKPAPVRAGGNALSEDTNVGSEDAKTQPLYAARPPAQAPAPVAAPPEPKPAGPPDPVVGWLVAIDGPERGRDFRLHAERNFVGRGAEMDVAIAADARVSRLRHAIVTFEPRKKIFYLSPGDASGLVYLNDDLLDKTVPIGPDDRIEIGDTKLKLVPFVTGEFTWS